MRDEDELAFRVVREVPGARAELLALAINVKLARAAYEAAAKEHPDDTILLKVGIRVIERSKR
jgi:hypothetical protein